MSGLYLAIFIIVQMLGPLMVLIFLCPGVNALQNEQAFPDIPFKVFNEFVAQSFSSKITLATVLMLFFTMTENTHGIGMDSMEWGMDSILFPWNSGWIPWTFQMDSIPFPWNGGWTAHFLKMDSMGWGMDSMLF